jgi:DNA-binding MarR family transcriptional regulator
LTNLEKRVLAYLEQRGPTYRRIGAHDLANLRNKGYSAQALSRMAGKITFNLRKAGLVRDVRSDFGFHKHYEITDAGRKALREGAK